MKSRLFVGLVASLALVAGFGQLTSGQSSTARIAAWNILGVDPIPPARINRIARTIRRINPDLIVLSEVNPNDAPSQIVQQLGAPFQPPIILQQNDPVVQNLAIIHKSDVTVSGARLLPGTDLSEEPRSRKALQANVRIRNFDFVLIGVHLKSGRSNSDRAKRTRQCLAISNHLSQFIAGSEKDVLVLGDYNMIPRSGNQKNDADNFHELNAINHLRFVSSEELNGQTSHISGCNPLRGNLLDGFAISREHTGEYREGSLRMPSFGQFGHDCRSFKRDVSDHRPLVARFRVTTDDD
jgi:endonuclease/exonuclease/phosphatase family metal-dependent hydrolase